MATFRVGMRVRIKYAHSDYGFHLVGVEAVVNEVMHLPGWDEPSYGLDISPIFFDGGWWGWGSDQLEPLTNANDLVSWESMRDLWVPEQYRVVA